MSVEHDTKMPEYFNDFIYFLLIKLCFINRSPRNRKTSEQTESISGHHKIYERNSKNNLSSYGRKAHKNMTASFLDVYGNVKKAMWELKVCDAYKRFSFCTCVFLGFTKYVCPI